MISTQLTKVKTNRAYWYGSAMFTILLLLSAWNSGNNILYLSFAFGFTFIFIAEVTSRLNFRKLPTLTVLAPDQVTRGNYGNIWLQLKLQRTLLPLFGLTIEYVMVNPNGNQERINIKKIPYLHKNHPLEFSVPHLFAKRGKSILSKIILSTSFPLGIIRKEAIYKVNAEIIVVPKTQLLQTQALGNFTGGSRVPTRTLISESGDFYSLREYQPGDDLRYIAWKISARLGVWLVREWALSLPNQYVILLDTHTPDEHSPSSLEIFEEMMDFTASIVYSLLMRQFRVGLWVESERIPLGIGTGHLQSILRKLALLQPQSENTIDENVWNKFLNEGRNSRLLVISVNPEHWGKIFNSGIRTVNPSAVYSRT